MRKAHNQRQSHVLGSTPKFLLAALTGVMLVGCAATRKEAQVTLPAYEDTYRWHSYRLAKAASDSPDAVFRLVSVLRNGDVELIYIPDGSHRLLRRAAWLEEGVASKMPIRIVKSDFEAQTAHIEWLTTN
jgi:hypothetical protein